MTNRFEDNQGAGQNQRIQTGGPVFKDAYQGQWQGQFTNPNGNPNGQYNEALANDQGYVNVPGGQALYGDASQGPGHHCGHHGGKGHFQQGGDQARIGPDGKPLAVGPDGKLLAVGPDGQPLAVGPDGQPLAHGHRRGHGHGGHGHHNPLEELNTVLTGDNALTSDQTTQIQQIEQQSKQGNQTTEQDLKLQKVTLAYDNATGDTSGVTAAQQSIATDQATLLTNKTAELQAIYGTLNPDQLQQVTTDLTNRQQKLSQVSSDGSQPGTMQDLRLQYVNLELAVAGGSNNTADLQSAQQAITTDEGTMVTNRIANQQQRFSSLQSSNPTEFQQLTTNLQNRMNKLSGNDSAATATTPVTTDATMTV